MRIGTWNLAGRWTASHQRFLEALECDVLLLTEVSERVNLPGLNAHMTLGSMAERRRWAGILSARTLEPLADPHGASALARIADMTFCSSVLPWRSCGSKYPWVGQRHADKTAEAVGAISRTTAPGLVWGGDWNHALSGREYSGSAAGRAHIVTALDELGLMVPTSDLPHRIDGLLSIDHIAVHKNLGVAAADRIAAVDGATHLSDHDAYVVELVPTG